MSLPLLHAGRTNPGLSAALDLRFALDKSLTAYRGPTPSFSRASTGSYFDASGVLRYQGYNLCQYSEDFTNAFWTKSLTSASSNVAIAPNGQQTADKIIESASAGFHSVSNTTFNLAASSTASVYLKAGERGFASVEIVDNFRAVINLSDGTVVSNTLASSTITTENAGNGWWRVKYTTNSSNLGRVIIYPLPTSTFGSYTGDGTSGIFAWGVQVETGATANQYSQTTNSANSGPRFDHTFNGTSWVSRGLLLEEQRTNLAQRSEDFGNAYYSKSDSSISANQIAAPDGATTADKLVENTANAIHYFSSSGYMTTNQTYACSIFVKAAERNWIKIYIWNGSTSLGAWFNLSSGTIGTTESGITSSIQNVGNGWYRCSITRAVSSGLIENGFGVILATADNSVTYTGDGSSGVYVWGNQVEAGSFSTSYIGTTSSSVTRSADVCQITGSDFSGFWNGTEGSIAAEYDLYSPSVGSAQGESFLWQVDDGTNNNRIVVAGTSGSGASNKNRYAIIIGASPQVFIDNQVIPANVSVYSSAAWKLNDAAFYSGSNGLFDTSTAIPTGQSNLRIGQRTGDYYLNGHIARLRYFNKRLPNATLQLLSEPDPTLNLQFALNKSLTPVAGPAPSFSRASTGSYFDSTGTLRYANVNLLTYSEQFDNAAWSDKAGSTLYTNAAASPNGDLSADQLQLSNSGYYYQKKAYTTTGTHTFSVWLRSSSPTTTLLRLSNDAGTENSVVTCNVTTSWQRFSVTRNWSANPVNFYAGLDQRTVVGGPGTSTDVFIWGAQLELASSPTQYAKTEASTTAGPRFDHVYSGGQWVSRGLLLEEQRTNSLLQSNGFGTSPWLIAASRGTVTQNATSPDGTTNAWTGECTVTTANGFYLQQTGISSPSGTYTFSMFAKKGNNGFCATQAYDSSGSYALVYFNLNTGSSGNLASSGYTSISHGMVDCGNGWYRCYLTFTKGNSNALGIYPNLTTNGMGIYDCTSGQTNLFYGMQLESGAFPTSYTGTTTNSVTRSADVCQITGTSFGSMWNQGEGSIVAEYDRLANNSSGLSGGYPTTFSASSSNSLWMVLAGSIAPSPVGEVLAVYDTTSQAYFAAGSSPLAGIAAKMSACYKANDFAASLNGSAVSTDTSGTVPVCNQIGIGYWPYGTAPVNGHIAKLIYYPARLTNTKLQQLST